MSTIVMCVICPRMSRIFYPIYSHFVLFSQIVLLRVSFVYICFACFISHCSPGGQMGGACCSNPELPKLALPNIFCICIAHTLMLHNLVYIQIISDYTVLSLSLFAELCWHNDDLGLVRGPECGARSRSRIRVPGVFQGALRSAYCAQLHWMKHLWFICSFCGHGNTRGMQATTYAQLCYMAVIVLKWLIKSLERILVMLNNF